jgi:hypothetical protein
MNDQRQAELLEHLPRDAKGNPISIGDRVWLYSGGEANPFVFGYRPLVTVCEIPVGGIGPACVFAHGSVHPIPSASVYKDPRDAFAVARAAVAGDRFKPGPEIRKGGGR